MFSMGKGTEETGPGTEGAARKKAKRRVKMHASA
jgi:hypothetical protein